MLYKIINSNTAMTWASFGARVLSFALPVIFLLPRFSAEQMSVWYLYISIIGLMNLLDMGFGVTFIRNIAYAMAGIKTLEDSVNGIDDKLKESDQSPNNVLLKQIVSTMRFIYNRIMVISFVIIGIVGSIILNKPIGLISNPSNAWIAWGVIIFSNSIVMRGNIFSSYLQGTNHIAVYRRWEALMFFAASLSTTLVAINYPTLLNLVLIMQFWAIMGVVRNWYLCIKILNKTFISFNDNRVDKKILRFLWPKVWRSGLGVFVARGGVEATGYIYAQFGETMEIASYLLSLRIIQIISQLSQAPFYSKIPQMATLYAGKKINDLIIIAKKGMQLSYWTYTLAFMIISISIYPFLEKINSTTDFINIQIWSVMGLAFILERYGAMHLQLYSITNHILWHISNSITGAIFLFLSILLLPKFGVFAFPLSILISNAIFYCLFAAVQSYGKFDMRFLDFEIKTSALPIFLSLLFVVYSYQYLVG